jgi:hypothetical protein
MKRNPITYVLIGIVIVVVIFPLFMSLVGAGLFKALRFHSRFENLVYNTDHHALLAECRALIDKGYRGKYIYIWPDRDPNVDNFPEIISQLKPTYVVVNDNIVGIELWGGMSHYGVRAYVEDFNEPYKGYYYGDKELINGLWFYSDFIDISKVD